MIVPMKKINIIVQGKDAESSLLKLRTLGVVHLSHQQEPKGKDIAAVKEDIAIMDEAMDILYKAEASELECMKIAKEPLDWKAAARHIIELYKRLDQLQEYSKIMAHNISEWAAWGDFEPDELKALVQSGIYIGLYRIPAKELRNIPQGVIIKQIFSEKGMLNCALISREKLEVAFKEIELPRMGLSKMKARLEEDARMIKTLQQDIRKYLCLRSRLKDIKRLLERSLEFKQALYGMGEKDTLVYLGGFIPFDAVENLISVSREEKWGVVVGEPSPEDNIPTLIRNPQWVKLINPVLKLLEILPGYRELDVSRLFFVFFGIFFGILIGDAGYGASYMLLTFLARKKLAGKVKDNTVFYLGYTLSFCAIVWGLITGSFFGQAWLGQTGFKPLIPALNDSKFMQAFCFFLGALHLSIAHSWRAFLKLPSLAALGDIGWICVLWSAFFFAKALILGDTLPFFVKWILLTGMVLVVLFTNPQKNIFKGAGEGLGTLALSLMNNFTDVVSYVRLFAVGMAGLAIAETCNTMANSLGWGNVFAGIAGILILLIGHSLNIVLGPMSVLVHGVRLNVLEFSGHANVSWSGSAYKPFK